MLFRILCCSSVIFSIFYFVYAVLSVGWFIWRILAVISFYYFHYISFIFAFSLSSILWLFLFCYCMPCRDDYNADFIAFLGELATILFTASLFIIWCWFADHSFDLCSKRWFCSSFDILKSSQSSLHTNSIDESLYVPI